MTSEDIISMAREAGMQDVLGSWCQECGCTDEMIERFAALVAAAERAACAKLCDEMWTGYGDLGAICSMAIRARGETK